jgi:integrase
MKLTKATIASLALPAGKSDHIEWDDELKGFGLRLRASGQHVWVCQYQIGPQQRRLTLGGVNLFSPDEARRWAREQLAKARLGQDPQAAKRLERAAAKVTLAAIAESHLQAKQPEWRPRTYVERRRYLTQHWQPLHKLPIDKITRKDIAACLSTIKQNSGDVAAARARSALSALCVWAMGEGITDSNPVIGTNTPAIPQRRERVLSDAEIVEVWNACQPDDYGRIVPLLLLTGARRGEVGGMTWQELDPEEGTWTIPGSRTKNKRQHVLPLPPMAWEIIKQVHPRLGVDHVFGRGVHGFNGWAASAAAMQKRMRPLPPWTVHDLRRTVATRMSDLGVQPTSSSRFSIIKASGVEWLAPTISVPMPTRFATLCCCGPIICGQSPKAQQKKLFRFSRALE